MPSKLIDLLIDLGVDAHNVEKLHRNTESFLQPYHLTAEELAAVHEALLKRNAEPIRKLIPARELAQSKHFVVNVQVNIL